MRPRQLLLVCGTGTEVGKTWVSVELVAQLRQRGHTVLARKPVQSYEPTADGVPPPGTDADLLGEATAEDPQTVCSGARWYPLAMAPPMAAEVLGRPAYSISDLASELTWDPGMGPGAAADLGIVETAGGVRSPLASDGGDTVDYIAAIDPDHVLLVADAGLGTINAVRSASAPFPSRLVTVLLNRYDPGNELHRRNREWLAERYGNDVVTSVEGYAERLGVLLG